MRILSAFVVAFLIGCGGAPAESTPPPATPAPFKAITLEKAPDSGQVDKVGETDGALKSDGVNDLAFALSTDGPVKAIFLVAVDANGRSNGRYQADTLIGDEEVPKDVAIKWGANTAGLGVSEHGNLVNTPDGSIPALPPGPHSIVLYIAPAKVLTPGTRLRVFVQRTDGTVDAGATIALD